MPSLRAAALLVACAASAGALVAPRPLAAAAPARRAKLTVPAMSYSEFDETGMRKFRWNLNVGRQPWGFALNAEVWNGRVAMMGFVWVIVQELVQGKGCITRIQEAQGFGDLVAPIAIGGVFFALVLALVTVIASSNEDDFFASEEILTELKNL